MLYFRMLSNNGSDILRTYLAKHQAHLRDIPSSVIHIVMALSSSTNTGRSELSCIELYKTRQKEENKTEKMKSRGMTEYYSYHSAHGSSLKPDFNM